MDDADPDGQTILVHYPSVVAADPYVRSDVRIECGAKSALDPHVRTTVSPYIADELSDFDLTVDGVTTIQPTRTFWDKVVIVHGLRAWFEKRGELRQEGQRMSRHYYDLHVIFPTDTGDQALADLHSELNASATPECSSTDRTSTLTTAAPGSFALAPVDKMLDALRRDYDAMAGMIIGSGAPVRGCDRVDRFTRGASEPKRRLKPRGVSVFRREVEQRAAEDFRVLVWLRAHTRAD